MTHKQSNRLLCSRTECKRKTKPKNNHFDIQSYLCHISTD